MLPKNIHQDKKNRWGVALFSLLFALLWPLSVNGAVSNAFVITITVSSVSAPTISSSVNQVFARNDPASQAAPITITEDDRAASITAANDIRIKIPAGLNLEWDTSVTTVSVAGSAAGKVSTNVSYPTSKMLLIDVLTDFSTADVLGIANLRFVNFIAASTAENLALIVGGAGGAVVARDSKYKAIGAPGIASAADQLFLLGQSPATIQPITVTDDPQFPVINPIGDIRIKIPVGLSINWDNGFTNASFEGSAAGKVGGIAYEDTDRTLVIDVTSSFEAGSNLIVSALVFKNFISISTREYLALEINNQGTNTAIDDKYLQIVFPISLEAIVLRDRQSGSTSYTASTEVAVAFTVTSYASVEQMQISEKPDLSDAGWSAYANPTVFTLSPSQGAKKVYARLKTSSGVTSGIASAGIILDTVPPAVTQLMARSKPLFNGDIIAANADFSAQITDETGVDAGAIYFALNGVRATDGTAANKGYDSYSASSKVAAYLPKSGLNMGKYGLNVSAADLAGNVGSAEVADLQVVTAGIYIIGRPLVYPSPANPLQGPIYFAYTLSKDTKVLIHVYDITMVPVWEKMCNAGAVGGSAGYNEVSWDGMTSFKRMIDNGVYFYRIISEAEGEKKPIGGGKFTVLK